MHFDKKITDNIFYSLFDIYQLLFHYLSVNQYHVNRIIVMYCVRNRSFNKNGFESSRFSRQTMFIAKTRLLEKTDTTQFIYFFI